MWRSFSGTSLPNGQTFPFGVFAELGNITTEWGWWAIRIPLVSKRSPTGDVGVIAANYPLPLRVRESCLDALSRGSH